MDFLRHRGEKLNGSTEDVEKNRCSIYDDICDILRDMVAAGVRDGKIM